MADPRVHELQAILPRCLLPDWVRLGSRLVRLLRDQHHPASHDAVLQRLIEQARASVALRQRRAARVPRVSYPPDLPVAARHEEIVAAIRAHQVVVIAGETGSGKTTQIPKMCLEAGLGIEAKIGCTQPRRVAALSISQRIAEELNVEWGREVGCKIRFDDRSSGETYIKLMTDGILLAETQGDPVLSEYNALILDEAHERSLNIDFLLGYLKGLLAKRADLKLIITSATIDTDAFSRHFGGAPIIEVSGRTFPVDVIYAPFEHEADTEETGSGERGTRSVGRPPSHVVGYGAPSAPSSHTTLEADIRSALFSPDDSLTYIDAAVRVTEAILCDSASGDLLIFLPGERDIRELRDLLDGRFGGEAEIVPLFGRLSSGEQQRVFAPTIRRKIVIATNIAETSLTIPGIRYVIDAGLARMSRYNPRTRTRRLPIEPVSQSSANQRKGRAGRVQDGICVRLYSEEDFLARPPHTQPEIQRANLAEVILRMKAFHLGEIEVFPFLNPPTPSAIDNGYKLLQELGALDDAHALTPLGEQLARLPIDPTLGRMLLQALAEGATNEMLVIAAGLSIQDPRERPLDQKDAAASAHKRFNHPRSDFLTLLNIWDAVHDEWERLRTQNQRRRFCKMHFLSYLRMVEWQDVHGQLEDALEELQRRTDAAPRPANAPAASYDAIHRSVLAGLLGHIAHREERNAYKAAGNRVLNVFPGSGLFERMDRKPQPRNVDRSARDGVKPAIPPSQQPEWVVAGEIVETSQLFARTLAGIDPEWIVQLASHLCKRTHSNPRWVASQGRVLADERITLHGLEVQMRRVDYGNINPREATEIFIRTALVEEQLFPGTSRDDDDSVDADARSGKGRRGPSRVQRHAALHQLAPGAANEGRTTVPPQFRFIEINRAVREKISHWRTRVRTHDLPDADEAMFRFYSARISECSSRDALSRLLRDHAAQPDFLCVTERDLVGERELSYDAQAFPDRVTLDEQPVALRYAYAPGEDWDGVTVQLPIGIAQTINESAVVWAVPGLREAQALELLRSLPRMLRRDLMPLAEKATEIARTFKPTGKSFLDDLAQFIHRSYGVPVQASSWPADALPAHLRPRVELMGADRKSLGASRDLESLRRTIEQPKAAPVRESTAWVRAAAQWERAALTGWTFGDLPERITVSEAGGLPVYAWPGLRVEDGHVCVRLFPGAETARRESLPGLRRLVELALQRDLGWVQKDLRALVRFEPMLASWMTSDELQVTAFEGLKLSILPGEPLPVLTQSLFDQEVELARRRVPGAAQKLVDQLTTILPLRQDVARKCPPPAKPAAAQKLTDFRQLGAAPVMATASRGYNTMAEDLAALMPKRFLETVPSDRRTHLPRYLKAMLVRFERAANNPAKDQERAKQLAPYAEFLRTCKLPSGASPATLAAFEELRWMVEEFRVSLFAQELGTAVPVSAKRLDQQVALVKAGGV